MLNSWRAAAPPAGSRRARLVRPSLDKSRQHPFPLAGRNRVNAGPQDLREVRPAVQDECHDRRREGRHLSGRCCWLANLRAARYGSVGEGQGTCSQ